MGDVVKREHALRCVIGSAFASEDEKAVDAIERRKREPVSARGIAHLCAISKRIELWRPDGASAKKMTKPRHDERTSFTMK
jgi:hypothetical protein